MLRKTEDSQSRWKPNVGQIIRGVVFSLNASLFLMPYNALAHHSFTVDVDPDKPGAIEGVISEVWFRNPHVRYYLEVTDKNGLKQKKFYVRSGNSSQELAIDEVSSYIKNRFDN